ncbi:MAG: alpha/beta hydrolase [Bacteroidetes bacterium]|nr:alpha/beta hydrolase [Fibrella sp.]
MNAFRRSFAWFFWIFIALLIIGIAVGRIVDFRQDDAAIAREFANQLIRPVIHRYTVADRGNEPRTIRFMETPSADSLPANSTRPTVIFIHGAPSSLSFFNDFFKDTTLLSRARLVSVDRPGYGYSDFGRVETSIIRQAELIQPLIDRYKKSRFLMLVGSSYGGSVVARLAMNNPGVVDHVVFVSSALGPGLERTYDISYWVDKPPMRWIVPPLLRLANDEKLAHRQALEAILPDWPRITTGITMLHGQRDDLVYPSNVAFAAHQLVHARVKQFILPENRHDIVFKKREYVTDIILNILAQRSIKPTPVRPMVNKAVHQVADKLALENVISVIFKL